MGLADDLNAPPRTPPFRVDLILASEVEGEDRDALLAALNDPKVSSRKIERACRANGIVVSDSAVQTWRAHYGVT